ncbi:transposable element Tc1 transposase [Trichonephila clavipes]|nr:transposable element Tc1 transposase [Trichonephila clavipes]
MKSIQISRSSLALIAPLRTCTNQGCFKCVLSSLKTGLNVSTVHDCWEQWSRDDTPSRGPGCGWSHGTTERKDRRIRRTAVAHCTASVSEIRAIVGTTITQRTVRNWLHQESSESQASCSVYSIAVCDASGVKPELNGGRSGDLLCFVIKAGGVLQHDNACTHTAVVQQRALQNVDMLPWPARSLDLSPTENAWDIIGRQLQHHPHAALAVPVLS